MVERKLGGAIPKKGDADGLEDLRKTIVYYAARMGPPATEIVLSEFRELHRFVQAIEKSTDAVYLTALQYFAETCYKTGLAFGSFDQLRINIEGLAKSDYDKKQIAMYIRGSMTQTQATEIIKSMTALFAAVNPKKNAILRIDNFSYMEAGNGVTRMDFQLSVLVNKDYARGSALVTKT